MLSERDRWAMGLDPDLEMLWRKYCVDQYEQLASDTRLPRESDYESVRLRWLQQALIENTRLLDLSKIVDGTAPDPAPSQALPTAPGGIYALRAEASHNSLMTASSRHASAPPSRATMHAEILAMISARLWMKSPAYFIARDHLTSPSPVLSEPLALPNGRCLVFHDHPLPLDHAPVREDQVAVAAWVFVADDTQAPLRATQVLTVSSTGEFRMVSNGAIDSPALTQWVQRILPHLLTAGWKIAPRPTLPGHAMERKWRRALHRERAHEMATGSLDAVRVYQH